MRRRDFIASTGLATGILATAPAAFAAPARLSGIEIAQIETAIKGGFGSGFTLRAAERADNGFKALIEHNENYLEVASDDMIDWSVLRATDM